MTKMHEEEGRLSAEKDTPLRAAWRAFLRACADAIVDICAIWTPRRRPRTPPRHRVTPPGACPSCESVAGYAEGPPCLTCHYEPRDIPTEAGQS